MEFQTFLVNADTTNCVFITHTHGALKREICTHALEVYLAAANFGLQKSPSSDLDRGQTLRLCLLALFTHTLTHISRKRKEK